MGGPAGPDERYCTSCGELIRREAKYCTYCGAPTRKGESREGEDKRKGEGHPDTHPAEGEPRRAGAEKDASTGEPWDGQREPEKGYAQQPGQSGMAGEMYGETPPEGKRDHDEPRVGAEQVGMAPLDESPLRTVGIALGIGVLGIGLLIIISLAIGIVGFGLQLPDLAVFGLATAVGQYVGFIGLAVWYLRRRGLDWDRVRSYLGVRVPTLREFAVVLLGYVAIFVLLIVVGIVVEVFLPEPAENEGAQTLAGADSIAVWAGAVLFMFLVVGPSEEALFRGVVQNRLRERLSAVPAILIASAVFAAVHVIALVGDPVAMLVTVGILFVPALVLGAVYEYTGNLVVPSLLHSIHNSVIVTILLFGPELDESAEFLSWLVSLVPL